VAKVNFDRVPWPVVVFSIRYNDADNFFKVYVRADSCLLASELNPFVLI